MAQCETALCRRSLLFQLSRWLILDHSNLLSVPTFQMIVFYIDCDYECVLMTEFVPIFWLCWPLLTVIRQETERERFWGIS